MKNFIITFLLAAVGIGALVLLSRNTGTATPAPSSSQQTNVTTADGKQVIHIAAKGGYAPRETVAKANTPTIINVVTSGTYDCSSSLNIPSIGFRQTLPASGVTPIEVPPQKPGSTLKGICAMGMYNFTVNFN